MYDPIGRLERLSRHLCTEPVGEKVLNDEHGSWVGVKKDLVVEVSAKHIHLCPEDLETLFGAGHELTPIAFLASLPEEIAIQVSAPPTGDYLHSDCATFRLASLPLKLLRLLAPSRDANCRTSES